MPYGRRRNVVWLGALFVAEGATCRARQDLIDLSIAAPTAYSIRYNAAVGEDVPPAVLDRDSQAWVADRYSSNGGGVVAFSARWVVTVFDAQRRSVASHTWQPQHPIDEATCCESAVHCSTTYMLDVSCRHAGCELSQLLVLLGGQMLRVELPDVHTCRCCWQRKVDGRAEPAKQRRVYVLRAIGGAHECAACAPVEPF